MPGNFHPQGKMAVGFGMQVLQKITPGREHMIFKQVKKGILNLVSGTVEAIHCLFRVFFLYQKSGQTVFKNAFGNDHVIPVDNIQGVEQEFFCLIRFFLFNKNLVKTMPGIGKPPPVAGHFKYFNACIQMVNCFLKPAKTHAVLGDCNMHPSFFAVPEIYFFTNFNPFFTIVISGFKPSKSSTGGRALVIDKGQDRFCL